jgi:hypothetical protein
MFSRDPDTPQLHLMPPEAEEEPPPPTKATGGDGDDDEPVRKPFVLPPPPPKRDFRQKVWVGVCAFSIVGVLGSLLAAGGHRTAVREKAAQQAAKWVPYEDATAGYALEHPELWTVSHDGNLTDFRDPQTGAAIRVGYQQPPANTPIGLWVQLEEQFKAEHPSYQRVRLSQTVHDGRPGAVWEFTWTDNGVDLHNYDLAFLTGPQSYALNFQTREVDWLVLQDTYNRFIAAFTPPG